MERIGFKEWAMVCAALESGRQSILLRKGGIAEGAEGFSFKHHEFFLFPTWFHGQPAKVREPGAIEPEQTAGEIRMGGWARLELTRTVTSWAVAEALAPFHILESEVVRERFDYDEAPGLQVAYVRVYRLSSPWIVLNEKRFGGCRSWVELPQPPGGMKLEPVLSEEEDAVRRREFFEKLKR